MLFRSTTPLQPAKQDSLLTFLRDRTYITKVLLRKTKKGYTVSLRGSFSDSDKTQVITRLTVSNFSFCLT